MGLAGKPTAIDRSGKDRFTTAPAPTIQPSPTSTPSKIVTPAPIQQSLPKRLHRRSIETKGSGEFKGTSINASHSAKESVEQLAAPFAASCQN